MTGTFKISELFTPSEIKRARELYRKCKPGTFNQAIVAQVVEPVMDRINKALGQENDARYIGYALEYVLMQESHHGQ